mmetsp:Transcript_58520/g.160573  ORF Transcript_58520/g.160573 Transcript_58520/m.160573 type:complete len:85 (+) Transcript_58520:109-363(+)
MDSTKGTVMVNDGDLLGSDRGLTGEGVPSSASVVHSTVPLFDAASPIDAVVRGAATELLEQRRPAAGLQTISTGPSAVGAADLE